MHCSTYCCFFLPILNPVNAVPFLPSPHCLLPPFSSSCLFSFSLSPSIRLFFLFLPSSSTGTSLKRARHARKNLSSVFRSVLGTMQRFEELSGPKPALTAASSGLHGVRRVPRARQLPQPHLGREPHDVAAQRAVSAAREATYSAGPCHGIF